MLSFLLIGLALVLTCIVGLLFTYIFYLDRAFRERKKYLQELERRSKRLARQLEAANQLNAQQRKLIDTLYSKKEIGGDVWAEVIDER